MGKPSFKLVYYIVAIPKSRNANLRTYLYTRGLLFQKLLSVCISTWKFEFR